MIDFNLRPIKEPRGFIRAIQFIFAILALCTTAFYSQNSSLIIECPNSLGQTTNYTISYGFKQIYRLQNQNCIQRMDPRYELDARASAEFYVTVGVLSMLYSAAALALYVLLSELYENNPMIALFDLFGTAVLTFFWFVGWCAWLANVSTVKNFPEEFVSVMKEKVVPKASINQIPPNFASLNISLVFGFANIFLWAASCWFVFKETTLHKAKQEEEQAATQPSHPRLQVPPRV